MDNDCLRLQNHKSEVPIATEQLARLPIIIIINHADFTVFSGTAGDCTGQGAAGASGPAKQAGKRRARAGQRSGGGGERENEQRAGTKSRVGIKLMFVVNRFNWSPCGEQVEVDG